MLCIDISVVDWRGKRKAATIKAVRGDQHPKLRGCCYYSYQASLDGKMYTGTVLHNVYNGAAALVAKLSRAIVMQQKADRKVDK